MVTREHGGAGSGTGTLGVGLVVDDGPAYDDGPVYTAEATAAGDPRPLPIDSHVRLG